MFPLKETVCNMIEGAALEPEYLMLNLPLSFLVFVLLGAFMVGSD